MHLLQTPEGAVLKLRHVNLFRSGTIKTGFI